MTATRKLATDKPSTVLDVYIGSVTDLPTSTNPTTVQLQQTYFPSISADADGIEWRGTITTPAQYVPSANPDYGKWNWTQLITASRQLKYDDVYWQLAVKITNNNTTTTKPINGIQVLDGGYPYDGINGGFWYPADGTRDGNSDSPYNDLSSDTNIRAYDIRDSFNDYLMYLPPGNGSVVVPLKETDWYWEVHATKDTSNAWSTFGENAQWSFGADFPKFPTWTMSAPVGSLTYAAP